MSISHKLSSLRQDSDITQDELARKFNVERKTISRAESGVTEPRISLLIQYAREFNVSLDYITGLIDTPKTIDGSPYRISKNITFSNNNIKNFNFKN